MSKSNTPEVIRVSCLVHPVVLQLPGSLGSLEVQRWEHSFSSPRVAEWEWERDRGVRVTGSVDSVDGLLMLREVRVMAAPPGITSTLLGEIPVSDILRAVETWCPSGEVAS